MQSTILMRKRYCQGILILMARDNCNETVEIIENEGRIIAIIILNSFHKPGISFFSPNDLILQVGSLCHPKVIK